MNVNDVLTEHKSFLKGTPEIFFSPGRVNLIGEHIDYLGGRVFPSAISLGTYAFVTKRLDTKFHFLSHNFKEFGIKVVSLDQLDYDEDRNWANYMSGMIQSLMAKGLDIPFGLNILIYGTLPNGAGLSSSASLEVLMGVILETIYQFTVQRKELVQIAQNVENKYVGVNCGIMDQFAVGMSEKDTAIYLDTNTLDYELIPLHLPNHVIVIGNTNKKRALSDSKYNERRRECDIGLEVVQKLYPEITDLCDVTMKQYYNLESIFPTDTIKRRVRHAITENIRTKQAVEALQNNDIATFGLLMNDSHKSLRDDYEVSCEELDIMVAAFDTYGAVGARMTGAGFGGCTVAIVAKENLENILTNVQREYDTHTSYNSEFYICDTSDGTRQITKEELE